MINGHHRQEKNNKNGNALSENNHLQHMGSFEFCAASHATCHMISGPRVIINLLQLSPSSQIGTPRKSYKVKMVSLQWFLHFTPVCAHFLLINSLLLAFGIKHETVRLSHLEKSVHNFHRSQNILFDKYSVEGTVIK